MSKLDKNLDVRPTKKRRTAVAVEESQTSGPPLTTNGNGDLPEEASSNYEGEEKIKRPSLSIANNVESRSMLQQRSILPIGGVGKSSMMALQINELLSQTLAKHTVHAARFKPLLGKLGVLINSIPNRPAATLVDAEKQLKEASGVSIPFGRVRPSSDIMYKFEYQTPTEITSLSTLFEIDVNGNYAEMLVVQMPAALFQEKDYLNHRALHKRAYYLACIATSLRQAAKDEFHIHYEYIDDNFLVPVLVVVSKENSSTPSQQQGLHIKIMASFPDESIPSEKTRPDKNCVRSVSSGESGTLRPTASYNNSLRYAASVLARNSLIEAARAQCESFDDAAELGRIWLQQRGIHSIISAGGFGQTEWRTICALLLKTGGHKDQATFSAKYSSLQLFKAMLQFLAGKDLIVPMITNCRVQLPTTTRPTLYDGNLGYNVLFKMSSWSYQLLKHEAALSVTAINSRTQDNHEAIFIMRTAEPLLKFDETYRLDLSTVQQNSETKLSRQELLGKLHTVLSRGLGDRSKLISLQTGSYGFWTVDKTAPKEESLIVELGLSLKAETASRLVDHGPLANETEMTADFRQFWGEKAELRRFKDGSISESLVWSEGMPVTLQILQHLLQQHFNIPASSIHSCNDHASRYLSDHPSVKTAEAFKLINTAYQTLASQLHHLEELPLRIRSVAPCDPQLSSTSLTCPLIPSISTPADIMIEFEHSAKWPDSLPAIQYTKIAFLHKLADTLLSSQPELLIRVGLENASTVSSGFFNTSYLDIIYPSPGPGLSPIPFRLRIKHDRELHLLSELLSSKSLPAPVHVTLQPAIATHKRLLAHTTHTATLRNLTTHFPALGPAIRLLKKWSSCHLLLNPSLLPSPLLDLLTIHVFTTSTPWTMPSTPQTAFLRVLRLLARWDWSTEPLIITTSLTSSLTTLQIEEIRTRFQAYRKLDPSVTNVVLFVASEIDPTGVVWTANAQPPRVIASRLTALARASIDIIKTKGSQLGAPDWDSLFHSPLKDFDFLLHLDPSVVRRRRDANNGKPQYKNLLVQEELDINTIGFDPAQLYLKDLEHVFGQSALFFHNSDGGKVIAGLWKPRIMEKKEWRVRMGVSTRPLTIKNAEEGNDLAMINREGVWAEMAIMGEGIVQSVEVVNYFI